MENITTRTVVIAVNIFVTITIVTLVIVMFFEMQQIYGIVGSTDNSIYNKFDDVYSMYNGRIETGIGLLNTLKKYEDNNDSQVIITYPNSDNIRTEIENRNKNSSQSNQLREVEYLKDLMQTNKQYNGLTYRYEDKYDVIVSEDQDNNIIINFQMRNRK